jgi:hypothetical protein
LQPPSTTLFPPSAGNSSIFAFSTQPATGMAVGGPDPSIFGQQQQQQRFSQPPPQLQFLGQPQQEQSNNQPSPPQQQNDNAGEQQV